MKKILLGVLLITQSLNSSFAQLSQNQQQSQRKIQVAILLDTSGSMGGLLSQAQSRIWNIVNSLTLFQYNGETPSFELALYEYGNSRLQKKDNYLECLVPLTTDLDAVSEKLFALSISGGEEYCGSVIKDALERLNWSSDPADMKLIYISGNEPFNQGPDHYKKVLQQAKDNDVIVNTIYCGPYEQGVRELWHNGAELAMGKFFNIQQNTAVRYIATPYDDSIAKLNIRLNGTYLAYGSDGRMKKEKQSAQDNLAGAVAQENLVERTVAKSSAAYINDSWDLVDYSLANVNALVELKKEDLPIELRGKTQEQMEEFLNQKRIERADVQVEIALLARKRQDYINENTKALEGQDDFGAAVLQSLIEIGMRKNFISKS